MQTQYITDTQNKNLEKSIIEWLKTFRFKNANSAVPKQCKLESAKVLSDLKRGSLKSFEEAVDVAQGEYNFVIDTKNEMLRYLAENGILCDADADAMEACYEYGKSMMLHGLELKEFYCRKADELVEKLKAEQVNAKTMQAVYKKLEDMNNNKTQFSVNGGKTVEVELPSTIVNLKEKWEKEAAANKKAARAQEKEDAKRKEEERKRKAEERKQKEAERKAEEAKKTEEYLKLHKQWEEQCREIGKKRSEYIAAERDRLINKPMEKLAKKRDKAVKEANDTIAEQTKRKAEAEETLNSLGAFKFGEKKAQKAIIEEATNLITEAQSALYSAESEYTVAVAKLNKDTAKKIGAVENEAKHRFVLPKEPRKPI